MQGKSCVFRSSFLRDSSAGHTGQRPWKHGLKKEAVGLAAMTAASLLLAGLTGNANAQDTWQGNTSTNWTDAGNWSPATNAPPASGDALIFGAAGSSGTSLTDNLMTPGSYSVAGITFNGPDAFVINPATLGTNGFTLSGSIANNGTSLETINDLISLTGTQTISTTSGGGNVTLGGAISGSGGLTASGSGILTLSGSNTYSGNTTITSGTTVVSGSIYGSGSNSATISVASGAILNVSSAGNNVIGNGSGATWNISGTLTETGGAVLTLPGNVILNGGTLTSTNGNSTFGAFYGGGAGTGYATAITGNGTGNTISATSIGLNGVLTLATPLATDTLLASTPFMDKVPSPYPGALTKTGSGTVTLSGASTYTGNTTISSGTVLLTGSLYGAGTNSATVSIATGATLNVSTGTFNVVGKGTNATWAVAGTLLESASNGVLTLPGNVMLVNGGTLDSSSTNSTGYGAYYGGSANYPTTITANGSGNKITAYSIGLAQSLTLAAPLSTDSLSASSIFFNSGFTGSITKTGLGTVTLSAANIYTGNTTVSSGTLAISGSLYGGGSNSATISVASGASLNASSGANNVLGDGSGAIWSVAGTLTEANSAAVLSIPAQINLSGGTLASTTSNTTGYGAFFGGKAGVGYATTINASGTGNAITAVSFGIDGSMTLSTPLVGDALTSSTLFFDRGGAGQIIKTGLGTVTFTGSNTYSGGTNLSSGTIQFTKTYSLPSSGTVAVASGATLDINAGGTNEFTTATSGSGSIGGVLGSATFASGSYLGIDTTNETAPLTYAGNITTAGLGLTKLGPGTLTLSGNNTYTGPTNVANGTLVVAGYLYGDSQSSATVVVGSGATLNVSSGSYNSLAYGANASWIVAGTLIQSNSGRTMTIPANITLSGGTLASSATNGSGYGAYFGGLGGAGYATTITANGSGNSITAVNFGINGVMTLATPHAGDSLVSSTDFFDRNGGVSSISKTGLGTLTLSGSSTYSGGTTVSAGQLIAANSAGSATGTGAVQIASGATLGGTGTISGAVTVNGTIAPGIANTSSPATLTIGAGSVLAGTSVIDLTSSNASDEIAFTGSASPNFSGGTLNVVDTTGFTLASGQTYSVFGYGSSTPTGTFATTSLPALSGSLIWNTSNLYTAGTISISSTNASGTWASASSGNWDTAGNWTGNTIATGAGQTATFVDSIGGGSATVTLVAAETVGTVSFSGSQGGSYTLAGNTLTLDNSGSAAVISVNAGVQTINTPITLVAGVNITTAAGSSLVIGGTVSGGTGPLTVTTGSSVSVAPSAVISVPLTVAGNLTFSNNSGGFTYLSRNVPSLNINSGGTVALQAGAQNTRQLLVTGSSISIGTTGVLDLANNDLLVQAAGNTGLSQISSLVAQAYNGGTWQGAGGITSSTAAADSTHLTALGVILNDDGSGTSQSLLSSFDGALTNDGDVLVKYTYYGDANLDGQVDGSDYSRIDNGVLNHLTGWFNGDFNYDGVINGSDYTLIDNAFNTQGAALASELSSPNAAATAQIAGTPGRLAAVPEPTSLALASLIGLRLLGRRRR